MEHSIISAYLALMLGCVIQGHAERTATLKEINGGNLQSFAQALKKFHDFIDMTVSKNNSNSKNSRLSCNDYNLLMKHYRFCRRDTNILKRRSNYNPPIRIFIFQGVLGNSAPQSIERILKVLETS